MPQAPADAASPARGDDSEHAPLRIAGVDPELRFAGGESQVLGLTHELIRAGQRAELVCDPRGELWKRARNEGVVCHPLSIRNALDLGAGLRLRALLSRERFDIVHLHTSRAHALAPYLRGTAGALLVTRRMDYPPNRWFAPLLFNRSVDGVAAISAAVADALERSGVSRAKVTVIASGVDTELFRPPSDAERLRAREALGIAPEEFLVGAIGALEARKGHRHLLGAVAALRATAGGASPIRCIIAGDGPLHAQLTADASCDDAVRLIGAIDDSRRLLFALDVFAFPSLAEGLGVALLEAMACGLPVVASAVGGIRDAVEHERSGLLCPPGDSSALAAAIRRFAASPAERHAMGEAARRRAQQHFAMGAMADQTLALYRRCLAMRNHGSKG
jgi:glycosyltransferase involved in cell wall biosynthesis